MHSSRQPVWKPRSLQQRRAKSFFDRRRSPIEEDEKTKEQSFVCCGTIEKIGVNACLSVVNILKGPGDGKETGIDEIR